MCRRKQHVKTGSVKMMSNLFCGKFAVGGNYNLMRNTSVGIEIGLLNYNLQTGSKIQWKDFI